MCSDESVAIMHRLNIMDGDRLIDPVGFNNCLRCHETSGGMSTNVTKEGVGCAGCHGPSEAWVDDHYRRDWSRASAVDSGFINASNLFTRARACASCHVGDHDRDMNHDIIAAGHPALRYEFATYHQRLPKHWRDHEADDETYYEAQLWLAGQVAGFDASLALLESRALESHTASVWPEFAAYDCASCHHHLSLDNSRRPITSKRKATTILSSWNDAGLKWLIRHRQDTGVATADDASLLDAIESLADLMQQEASPDGSAVAAASRQTRATLEHWFNNVVCNCQPDTFRSDGLAALVVSAAGRQSSFATWESAVQLYLAAVAARSSWPGGARGQAHSAAHRMREGLKYPEMTDVSRYAKRGRSESVSSRARIMADAVELAGWLGPVRMEFLAPEQDDDVIARRMQDDFRRMIERINARWEAEYQKRNAESDKPEPDTEPKDESNTDPAPQDDEPKNRAELSELLELEREKLESLQQQD